MIVFVPPPEPAAISTMMAAASQPLPAAIRDLAQSAFDAGDDAALDAILKMALQTYPRATEAIDALTAEFTALRTTREQVSARVRANAMAVASPLENWKGEIELGGSLSTGNTSSFGAYGAFRYRRDGLEWTHMVNGRVDFQRSDGRTIADRFALGWEPGYKFDEGVYLYGLGQFERDRFLGYSSRFTLSSGLGVALVARPKFNLSLQGGPAIRIVDDVTTGRHTVPAGRASLAMRWKLAPTIDLTQNASFYLEEDGGGSANALASSSVETALSGALKARLSYNVQYEHSDVVRRKPIDTTSRVTLVYSF